MAFPLVFFADTQLFTSPNIVIEVLDLADLWQVRKYGVSLHDFLQERITEVFDKKDRNSFIEFVFYPTEKQLRTITLFLPRKDHLLDDRSDFFRKNKEDIAFVPGGEYLSAFQAFALTTYISTPFKKTKKYILEIFIPESCMNEIKSEIPLLEAIFHARDRVNAPAEILYPWSFVEEICSREWKNFHLEVFSEEDLEKIGCNLLLAVGRGSKKQTYMVVLTPKNPPNSEKYALIGKWVTFDAGGIQIKPDKHMVDMKCDMAWAAAVIGVAEYLDTLDTLPVNLICAIGLTENMTGWDAYKPLDIYRAYNGITVEIHHTDAEGRLVLADVMSYVERNHHVQHTVTLATLTGAVIYALWNDIAGIMGDDEWVISTLLGTPSSYESLWRLPLTEKMKKSLESDFADIKNISHEEKAGSSVWGAFLSYFQGDSKLTHIDIAWPAFRTNSYGYMPKNGTWFGVMLLSRFFQSLGK